jgi:hypothetical protein
MLTHDDLSAAVFSGTHMIRGCGIPFRSGFNIGLYSGGIESEDLFFKKKKKQQKRAGPTTFFAQLVLASRQVRPSSY